MFATEPSMERQMIPSDPTKRQAAPALSRRNFVTMGAGTALAPLVTGLAGAGAAVAAETAKPVDPRAPLNLSLKINGDEHQVSLDGRTTLLDALRETIGLTGTKKGCDHGQCGACTVHIDGVRVVSCLTLAATVQGRQITTIEGLAGQNGDLHPMQAAFVERDALQCGYCTPGQIMSAVGCVKEGHAKSDDEIREYMSGNLCRCAAYPNILAAIKQAAPQMEG